MSVGFGFSAGDFVAAVDLVGTIIDALRDSGEASSEYRELVRQLFSLETALLQVKRLEPGEGQYVEAIALRQAAAQCQRTIDEFWNKVRKYQSHLTGGSTSRVKSGWMKIKWAVCKKEDVSKFKADLVGHTESINLLLTTVQMASTNLERQNQDNQSRSIIGKVQESYFGCMQRLSSIMGTLQTGIDQGQRMLEVTIKVLQTNVRVFQIVCDIQRTITEVPGQVERQQPVYLIDALGRSGPFHLEFIRSSEAFLSVLKVNFKQVGRGAEMIDNGEFAIQDSITKDDIDLTRDWDVCFSPGQRVEMSMVFSSRKRATSDCPKCKTTCRGSSGIDIECHQCGMNFRRVFDGTSDIKSSVPNGLGNESSAPVTNPKSDFFGPANLSSIRKRKREGIEDELSSELGLFRRVRIRTLRNRVKVYELRNNDWYDRGTGFCFVQESLKTTNFEDELYHSLIVRSEVKPVDLLLDEYINPNNGFQKQQQTALSFQKEAGCTEIWNHISNLVKVL